ncbi:hypothetical protein [Streptomyces sp. NRRL S-1868]|nr:hypothetical protein [Streptomyces sp. NRRL S-1868]
MAAVRTQLCHPRFNHVGEATALGERIGEFSAAAAAHKLGAETLLALDS